jgi:hypothetical protein
MMRARDLVEPKCVKIEMHIPMQATKTNIKSSRLPRWEILMISKNAMNAANQQATAL